MSISADRTNFPTHEAPQSRTMVAMTMYVDILSRALDCWVDELTGSALVDYALACRAEMLGSGPYCGDTAHSSLAAEIAYDRALIKLCERHNVPAIATGFAFPGAERARLQHELATAGVDLPALARRSRET